MKKYAIALFGLILAATAAQAQFFSDSTTVGINIGSGNTVATTFRLRNPASGNPVAILLVSGANNGFNAGNKFSTNAGIAALADQLNLAIIAFSSAGSDTGLVIGVDPLLAQVDSLEAAVGRLADASNTPALENCAAITYGHGKGARFAQQAAIVAPDRVAAVISFNTDTIITPSWASAPPFNPAVNTLRNTPHLVFSGEVAGPDINVNRLPYYAQAMHRQTLALRAQGHLVHQYVDANRSFFSLSNNAIGFISAFIAKTVGIRIPAGANPALGTYTLNTVAEASGYLGTRTAYNTFAASAIAIAPYSAGAAATSFWMYDQQHAELWRNGQVTRLTFTQIPPVSQATPYCSGSSFSGGLITFSAPAGIARPGNVYRLEISNIYGDFDNPEFPGLVTAAIRSASGSVQDTFLIPDNFQIRPTIAAGTVARYRFKVSSSDSATFSSNAGESPFLLICDPYRLILNAVPGQQRLAIGQPFSIKVSRTNALQPTASNRVIVELSDSLGRFDSPTIVVDTLLAIPSTGVGFPTSTLTGRIPANTPRGIRYKLRARITDPVEVGSSNGGYLELYPFIPSSLSEEALQKGLKSLVLVPNPAQASFALQGAELYNATVTVLNTNGQVQLRTQASANSGQQIAIDHLPAGLYLVHVQAGNSSRVLRLAKF